MFIVLLEGFAVVLGTAGLGFLGWLFSTKKGRARGRKIRAWGKRKRKATGRKIQSTGKSALAERRRRRDATPRGQLRKKRQQQPHRLTVGRVRAADDPHPVRVVAGAVAKRGKTYAAKRKVAKLNRAPKPSVGRRVAGFWQTRVVASGAGPVKQKLARPAEGGAETCQASNVDGSPCGNLEELDDYGVGTGACYLGEHKRQVRQMAAKDTPWNGGRRYVGAKRLSGAATSRDKLGELRPGEAQARADRAARAKAQPKRAASSSHAADRAGRPVNQNQAAAKRTEAQGRRVSTHGIQDQLGKGAGGRSINNSGVMNLGSGKVNVTNSKFGPGARVETSAPAAGGTPAWVRDMPKPSPSAGGDQPQRSRGGGIENHGGNVNVSGQAFGDGAKVVNHPPKGD